ncbi:MAG: hypothetical protein HRU26_17535 [Psychroserpens sp.]|nr:hypothetical protein [Psychroserpens sp.]
MIEEEFENIEMAEGAMFTIRNNFKTKSYSIGVEGKTLRIWNMPKEVYEAFKASEEWWFIEVFGLFKQARRELNQAELYFDEAKDKSAKSAVVLNTKNKIQQILDRINI